jgi:hypothetical protein
VAADSLGPGRSGVAVAAGRAILYHRVSAAEVVESLDAATGRLLWLRATHSDFGAPAAFFGAGSTVGGVDHVLIVTRYACLLLEPQSGEIRWLFPFGIGSVHAAFDAVCVTKRWEGTDSLATQYCTPIAAGDHVWCIDGRDGKLLAAKTDGELVLMQATPTGSTVLARGRPLATGARHIWMKAPIGPTPIDIRCCGTSEKGSAPPPWRAGACVGAARSRSAVARAASADA